MNNPEGGIKGAVEEIISGIITSLFIDTLAKSSFLPSYALIILNLVVILPIVVLIAEMRSWGIIYTFGWLFGSFIFLKSGLLGFFDIILYLVLPIAFLIIRFVLWIRESSEGYSYTN